MTCKDCAMSATQLWHGFRAGCTGCRDRAISRGVNFAESRKAGRQTPRYRAELEQFGTTHEAVLDAHRADFANHKESR